MNSIKIIQAIDFIFKKFDFKYRGSNERIYIIDENKDILDSKILEKLSEEKCLEIIGDTEDIYYEGEYRYTEYDKWILNINTLLLFEYKRRLLGKYQKSIINTSTLERIARFIGDSGNAQSIIEILRECGVPDYLIIYPNTKWRMVYDIFKILSTSIYEEGHKLLFGIIEAFLSPIRYDSIEDGIEKQKYFSDFLSYDGYVISKGKIAPLEDKKDMYDIFYENKEGKIICNDDYDKIKAIISDSGYKKVTLLKGQDGKIDFIEGERHINRGQNRFVDLEKKYPFAEITSKTHNGKTQEFIVNEKIKLKNNGK